MELNELIELGVRQKGSLIELANHLGVIRESLSAAKAHKRGLPADACMKLSKLIGVPFETVIGASELATERKEEKRAFWLPFVTNTKKMTKAASYALILGFVTNLLTATPAEAAPVKEYGPRHFVLCKVRKIFYALRIFCVLASNFCKCFVNRSLAAT